MKAKIIAIANHKGGVGKSTTTACLGAALTRHGYKVLVVDLDAQQNLTYMMTGCDEPEVSIYDALVKKAPLPIIEGHGGVDVVPASLELARIDIDLFSTIAKERKLELLLKGVAEEYDYILIDCPPSLGTIVTNALVAADELYIPLTAEALPLKGLAMLEEVVKEVTQLVNPRLRIGGVIFTRYNSRRLNKDVVNIVKSTYGDAVFNTKIRENITVAEVPLTGQTIYEYDPDSAAAQDYNSLAEEIIERSTKIQ